MGDETNRTLWVGNLTDKVTEELLYELFLQAGPLVKVTIPKDRDGRPKRFAFIVFKHECSVPYTIKLFDGLSLFGYELKLQTRSGSVHSSPANNQNVPSPTNMPKPLDDRVPSINRSNTWHGDDIDRQGQKQGQTRANQNQGMYLNPVKGLTGQDEYSGSRDYKERNNLSPHQAGAGPSRRGPGGTFEARRDRVLHQHMATVQAHRARQQQQSQNPYNQGRQPWQAQGPYQRRY
ncbi:hypothetical protein CHS0354_007153 [Potamilus streckersoni]|uniref:RRM domain-containing protein n=1 Tax=Potamilus streckersoni TaxID=2493646 RepID=A0AAE0VVK6_9BIVA|nr:hypothetical protein CHS0354_007153 [Potamilus streckersoni]